MSAGELRNLLELQRESEAVSDNGDTEVNKTWEKVADVWGRIIYAKGTEVSDNRDSTLGKATIKIRWRSDVTNKMRFVFQSDIYAIQDNFDQSGKRQYLMIPCDIINA